MESRDFCTRFFTQQAESPVNQPTQHQYDVKTKTARRAEHSMLGQARAVQLQEQLDALQSKPTQSSSMAIPRMKWEVNAPNASDAFASPKNVSEGHEIAHVVQQGPTVTIGQQNSSNQNADKKK